MCSSASGIREPVRPLVAQRRTVSGRYTTRAFEHIAMRADRGGGTTPRPDGGEWTRARVWPIIRSMHAVIAGLVSLSDDDLMRVSRENPGWRFERTGDGALIVSPTSTPGGAKSLEAAFQLKLYAKRAGGKAYDSSTGFKTPAGGVVSPDAAWLSAERVARFAGVEGYWRTMPDVAIEVASPSDRWLDVARKIDAFVADGAGYAIAIDPATCERYERGAPPADLALDVDAIIDA